MCVTLTKCCFCFPLREGVLCYGYIHLILCVLGAIYLVGCPNHGLSEHIILPAICAGLLMLDALFLVILLIACHKKNDRLLKTPLMYNKVWLVVRILFTAFIAFRMVSIYFEEPSFVRSIVLYMGLIILSSLVCDICIKSYVILWIKGLMKELKKQSPTFDITTESSHIVEVAKDYNEEIQVQFEEVEDKGKDLNTENIIEVQINEEKVTIQADGDKLNATNKNEVNVLAHSMENSVQDSEIDQDIKLQVLN